MTLSKYYMFSGTVALATVFFLVASSGAHRVHAHGKGHQIGKDEHSAIQVRHELMTSAALATKTAGAMLKKKMPYNPMTAELAMRTILSTAVTLDSFFPAASKPGKGSKSEASPKIWTDMEGFMKEAQMFKIAAGAAAKTAGKGEAEFKEGFLKVIKSCKSCHESYRIKKE